MKIISFTEYWVNKFIKYTDTLSIFMKLNLSSNRPSPFRIRKENQVTIIIEEAA